MKISLLIFLLFLFTGSFAKENEKLITASIEVSDLEYTKIGNEFDLDWRINLSNADQSVYEVSFEFEHNYQMETDHTDSSVTRDSQIETTLDLARNDLFGRLGIVSYVSYEKRSHTDAKKNTIEYELTPIGLKVDFLRDSLDNQITISAHPQFKRIEFTDESIDSNYNFITTEKKLTKWFYALRLQLSFNYLDNKLDYQGDSWLKASPGNSNDELMNGQNKIASSEHNIYYNLNQYLSLGYRFFFEYDQRRKTNQNLPSTDIVNGITFKASWN